MNLRHTLCLSCLLTAVASPVAWADAQEECEQWARQDNVSAMLWDRYVDSCVQSLQDEGLEEPPQKDQKEPAGLPPTPEPPGVDLSY